MFQVYGGHLCGHVHLSGPYSRSLDLVGHTHPSGTYSRNLGLVRTELLPAERGFPVSLTLYTVTSPSQLSTGHSFAMQSPPSTGDCPSGTAAAQVTAATGRPQVCGVGILGDRKLMNIYFFQFVFLLYSLKTLVQGKSWYKEKRGLCCYCKIIGHR